MTFVGLACVALVSPSELWTGLVFVVAVGSLLVAGLCIIYRDGRARAFAVGFVIFAASYLFVALGDTPDVPDAHTQLPTTRWGIALYTLLHGDKQQIASGAWPTYTATRTYSAPLPASGMTGPPPPVTIQQVVVASASSTIAGPSGPPVGASAVPVTTFVPTTINFTGSIQPEVPLGSFLEVTHNVLAIFLGVLGGIVAQILHSTRREKPTAHSS